MAEKEYIEREAALKDYQTICNGVECARCPIRDKGHCKFEAYIRSIPAADVRPVVRGRWIPDYDYAEYDFDGCTPLPEPRKFQDGWQCSLCGQYESSETNFCPNCGAMMEGN